MFYNSKVSDRSSRSVGPDTIATISDSSSSVRWSITAINSQIRLESINIKNFGATRRGIIRLDKSTIIWSRGRSCSKMLRIKESFRWPAPIPLKRERGSRDPAAKRTTGVRGYGYHARLIKRLALKHVYLTNKFCRYQPVSRNLCGTMTSLSISISFSLSIPENRFLRSRITCRFSNRKFKFGQLARKSEKFF